MKLLCQAPAEQALRVLLPSRLPGPPPWIFGRPRPSLGPDARPSPISGTPPPPGTDAGQDPARWLQWWEANRRSFEIPAMAPKLSGDYANQWARFWGEDRTYERRKKRSDRG